MENPTGESADPRKRHDRAQRVSVRTRPPLGGSEMANCHQLREATAPPPLLALDGRGSRPRKPAGSVTMTAVTPPSVWPMPCASLALSLTSDRPIDRSQPAEYRI